MSSILPLFAITSAFAMMRLASQGNIYFKKIVVKPLYFYYLVKEMRKMLTFPGDKDIYNLQIANSSLILDYSEFARENPSENFSGFERIESVFTLDPFRVPPATQAHTADEEKITSLSSAMSDPMFYRMKSYMPLRQLEMQVPGLRMKYEPYTNKHQRTMSTLAFLREMNEGGPLPQLFYMNAIIGEHFTEVGEGFIFKMINLDCYEHILDSPFCGLAVHEYHKTHIWRIKGHKHCRDRMIKRGYYHGNKSLGHITDFERAYQGFESPLKTKLDALRK